MNINQLDTSYWFNLAEQWIQSKSQTQLNFPNYPFPSQAIPAAPSPPRISHNDATINDNLVEADMDLDEDVKEEEPTQVWANWQQENNDSQTAHNIQQQPPAPVVPSNHGSQKFLPSRNNSKKIDSEPLEIPRAPFIGQISESSQSVDMVLDSDDEDNSSAIMEAQKRKKLPLWIREGLERIEKEKKLEEIRQQKEKEQQKDEENRKRIMEEALKELEREKVTKSKYVS